MMSLTMAGDKLREMASTVPLMSMEDVSGGPVMDMWMEHGSSTYTHRFWLPWQHHKTHTESRKRPKFLVYFSDP